jgi:hypothetical protein
MRFPGDYLRTRNREDGDGARPRRADRFQIDPGEVRRREADAVAEQHRQYVHQDLVDKAPLQALGGDVATEDLKALAARGAARRRDRLPDVAGEVRDARIRWLRWPMGEHEHGSGKGVVDAARLLGLHPVADVGGPPADEHRAGGRRDLVELVRADEAGELATSSPVHHMAGSGDEAVERHTPVHDDLAVSGARIVHPVPHRDSVRGRTQPEAAGYRFLAKPGPTAALLPLSKGSEPLFA